MKLFEINIKKQAIPLAFLNTGKKLIYNNYLLMKITFKIKTIFASLLLIAFTYSCSDLNQEFYGDFKDEDLWNTKTDFDQAINGAVIFFDGRGSNRLFSW
jgi:Cu/Ag efflux pump CusA